MVAAEVTSRSRQFSLFLLKMYASPLLMYFMTFYNYKEKLLLKIHIVYFIITC